MYAIFLQQFDLFVVGNGSTGEGAIDEVHRSGDSITIVEKDKVGCDCPNVACVPTSALVHFEENIVQLKLD